MKLLETAKTNDFFDLFGLDRKSTLDQVSAKRRQLNKELHPDQFQEKEEKEKASQKLALINYQKEMTKAYMPQQLLQELDEVLQLLKEFRGQLNFENWTNSNTKYV